MNKSRGVSGRGGAVLAALLTVGATVAMQAQSSRGDGIKVHGHWTIDVQNADGSLASHNEIENELQPTGGNALAELLSRASTPSRWQLDLLNGPDGGPCARQGAPVSPNSSITIVPVSNQAPVGFPYLTQLISFVEFSPFMTTEITQLFPVDPDGDPVSILLGASKPASLLLVNNNGGWSLVWDPTILGQIQFGDFAFTLTVVGGQEATQYNVNLHVIDPATLPPPEVDTTYPCSAVEAGTTITNDLSNAWFPTLTLGLVGNGATSMLQLSGNVTVSSTDPIDRVRSILVTTSGTFEFSAKTLSPSIQVVPGQKVYVKVVFSFS